MCNRCQCRYLHLGWAGEGGGTEDQGGDIVVIWYDGEDNKRVAWGGVAVTIAFKILALPILACDVSRWRIWVESSVMKVSVRGALRKK